MTSPFDGADSFSTGDSARIVVSDNPEVDDLDEDEGFSMDADEDFVVPNEDDDVRTSETDIALEEGDSVRLVWLSSDRESSQTLYQTEVSTGV